MNAHQTSSFNTAGEALRSLNIGPVRLRPTNMAPANGFAAVTVLPALRASAGKGRLRGVASHGAGVLQ